MDMITIVRGATVGIPFLVELPAGNWAGSCRLKDGGGVTVSTLSVTLDPLPAPDVDGFTHAGLIGASSIETEDWRVGACTFDLRFSDDQAPPNVVPSDPFPARVRA